MHGTVLPYDRWVAITASRLKAIQQERTALLSIEEVGALMHLRVHQVQHLCNRGMLQVATCGDGVRFSVSDARQAIEVSRLWDALSPRQSQALEAWLHGTFDSVEEAVAAVGLEAVNAHAERSRERSEPLGAL